EALCPLGLNQQRLNRPSKALEVARRLAFLVEYGMLRREEIADWQQRYGVLTEMVLR
ncbi:MAG: hypothetical protein HY814_00365, partial [Candidatus Riflebacteria bacterium]|nr:hypothetical protein [Candidatus Riflebacteria bacterium]